MQNAQENSAGGVQEVWVTHQTQRDDKHQQGFALRTAPQYYGNPFCAIRNGNRLTVPGHLGMTAAVHAPCPCSGEEKPPP